MVTGVPESPVGKKRKKPVLLTSRAEAFWRDLGFDVENVEHLVPFVSSTVSVNMFKRGGARFMIRRDAWGFADLEAVHPERQGTLYIQVTSRANASTRMKKAMSIPSLIKHLKAGNNFCVQSFAKRKVKGRQVFQSKLEFCKLLPDGRLKVIEREGIVLNGRCVFRRVK